MKRDSWHFKLVNEWTDGKYMGKKEISLCPYMRSLFFSIFMAIFSTLFLGAILCLFLYFLTYPVWQFFYIPHNDDIVFLSAMLWIIVGVGALMYVDEIGESEYNPTLFLFNDYHNEHKEPNIFFLYLKALHDKVCPTIKLED
jgi:hypothetical protein